MVSAEKYTRRTAVRWLLMGDGMRVIELIHLCKVWILKNGVWFSTVNLDNIKVEVKNHNYDYHHHHHHHHYQSDNSSYYE